MKSHVQVKARIQAHPSRSHLHGLLAKTLDLPAEIVLHESDPPSPWDGYRKCLTDLPDCSHLLIIQDDAVVCRNFGPAIKQIAEANPDVPVCLFLAHLPRTTAKQAVQAAKRKECYVRLHWRDFMPVVGVMWPVEVANRFLKWSETARLPGQPNPRSDDAVCGRWVLETREEVLVTIPSLVQHPDHEPSLIGKRASWGKDRGRVALFFCEGDPLDYKW